MKNILEFLLNLFLWIISLFVVVTLTNDKNFGELKLQINKPIKEQFKEWRLSLIQIMCGAKKYYICTVNREVDDNQKTRYHFHFFKRLALEDLLNKEDHNNQIYPKYFKRLCNPNNKNIQSYEKESLIYHIESEKSRIDKSDNKINIYTTVLLTVLPILVGLNFFEVLSMIKKSIFFAVVFSIVIYLIINVLLYLYQYIKVGSYSMSSFSELKNEQLHQNEKLIAQYYFDFQALKNKADMFVSYVINIQKLIALSFFLLISILIYYSLNTHAYVYDNYSSSIVYNIDVNSLNDPYSSSSIDITNLKLNIQTKNADIILILFNNQTDISDIKKELLVFDNSIEIKYINDDQLEKDKSKILVIKE